MSRLLIKNSKTLYGHHIDSDHLRGLQLGTKASIDNAFVLVENDRILKVGPMAECPDRADKVIDVTDSFVLPAWCDSHSHIVYHSSREAEFEDRINGLSYEEIAERGGGILNSAEQLAKITREQLLEESLPRLEEVKNFGTGALEIKSGYGLSLESELKMLRVIQDMKSQTDLTIKSTFLGAHAIPREYKSNRSKYIDLVCDQMIPQVAEENLADYCDVFCERGYFTPDETKRILETGLKYGLSPKVHANEMYLSGGVQVGVEVGARSVDHLECLGKEELGLLSESSTCSTLLPSTAFFLSLEYAPARKLIERNAIVALASDYNPGTTPSGKMPFVLSLACIKMKMTPIEALNAATINGAYAMDLSDDHGSIRKGNVANLIITKKIPSLAFIPYAFGSELIESVIIRGKVQ